MRSEPLWTPSKERVDQANLTKFIKMINNSHSLNLESMKDLHKWSIENEKEFWKDLWDFGKIIGSNKDSAGIIHSDSVFERDIFVNAKINFAKNILKREDDYPAIFFNSEDIRSGVISFKKLKLMVIGLADYMYGLGVRKGDVVAGYMANVPETVIAALATAALGAVWTACSPDFGVTATLDRLQQVSPKLLFAVDGYSYKGKIFNVVDKVESILSQIPTIEHCIWINHVSNKNFTQTVEQITTSFCNHNKDITEEMEKIFADVDFYDPLYIMFSSGTTGAPKSIVHAAGTTLLQHFKEHQLHCDIKKNDVVFYFTACSWMMWHWLVSSLASGASIVLYDGFPMFNNESILFDLVDEYKITFFGVPAKYIDTIMKSKLEPSKTHNLSSLRSISTTGSPLVESCFHYVYQSIKNDVHLAPLSGGTDIISCFVIGDPISSVYAGEMQSAGLAMDLDIFTDEGMKTDIDNDGYLVCKNKFLARPIYFWNDHNNEKYYETYFSKFSNIWNHGDWIKKTENGGFVISGRADATLKPSGVRIGTAEIYSVLQKSDIVAESVVVGQRSDGDEKIILFIIPRDGKVIDEFVEKELKNMIRDHTSTRHVPAKIIQVSDIPRTRNGKISEIAVKDIINGNLVKNLGSLQNPESLQIFELARQKL